MVDLTIVLPEGFLEEEVRSGHFVSSDMKQAWAVMLDLLSELLRVCGKHNLRVFASEGTLLGAVRHQGFIPWDDDLDLCMFRDDFNKLLSLGGEFRHPYFLQSGYSDKDYIAGLAKLRNSDTTGIQVDQQQFFFNQGICIDIFPLDNYIEDEKKRKRQENRSLFWRMLAYASADYTTRFKKDGKGAWLSFVRLTRPLLRPLVEKLDLKTRFFALFDKECQRYNNVPTEYVSVLCFRRKSGMRLRRRSSYDNTVNLPFEFMTIPCPSDYDRLLSDQYGDWHEFVKGAAFHKGIIFDTSVPYTEYYKKIHKEAVSG